MSTSVFGCLGALVALRLLQGMASRGEWGGGVLMIRENAPLEKRGYYAAWNQLGVDGDGPARSGERRGLHFTGVLSCLRQVCGHAELHYVHRRYARDDCRGGRNARMGRLSDLVGRQPVYMFGAISLPVMAFPFFWLLDTHSMPLVWLAVVLGAAACHGVMIGTLPALVSELFSTEVCYSGVALGQEVEAIFAGGLSSKIATALLSRFHAWWPLALLPVILGLITAVSLKFARETHRA